MEYEIELTEEQALYMRYKAEFKAAKKRIRKRKLMKILRNVLIMIASAVSGVLVWVYMTTPYRMFISLFLIVFAVGLLKVTIDIILYDRTSYSPELEQINAAYENAKMMQALKAQARAEVIEEMKEGR